MEYAKESLEAHAMHGLAGFARNVSINPYLPVAFLVFVAFSTFRQAWLLHVDLFWMLCRGTNIFTNIKNVIMYMVSFKTARIIDVWGS